MHVFVHVLMHVFIDVILCVTTRVGQSPEIPSCLPTKAVRQFSSIEKLKWHVCKEMNKN